ncbi:hypothetical protein NECID01_2039 [Nematocida sp. AWRm77]|nr:hypothetical protein NECID01_2039 [Nematocida sp. AWRm77]
MHVKIEVVHASSTETQEVCRIFYVPQKNVCTVQDVMQELKEKYFPFLSVSGEIMYLADPDRYVFASWADAKVLAEQSKVLAYIENNPPIQTLPQKRKECAVKKSAPISTSTKESPPSLEIAEKKGPQVPKKTADKTVAKQPNQSSTVTKSLFSKEVSKEAMPIGVELKETGEDLPECVPIPAAAENANAPESKETIEKCSEPTKPCSDKTDNSENSKPCNNESESESESGSEYSDSESSSLSQPVQLNVQIPSKPSAHSNTPRVSLADLRSKRISTAPTQLGISSDRKRKIEEEGNEAINRVEDTSSKKESTVPADLNTTIPSLQTTTGKKYLQKARKPPSIKKILSPPPSYQSF